MAPLEVEINPSSLRLSRNCSRNESIISRADMDKKLSYDPHVIAGKKGGWEMVRVVTQEVKSLDMRKLPPPPTTIPGKSSSDPGNGGP